MESFAGTLVECVTEPLPHDRGDEPSPGMLREKSHSSGARNAHGLGDSAVRGETLPVAGVQSRM